MIFSTLFKDKWKSKKVAQRLQAITELQPTVSADKIVLVNLAENDVDSNVRSAALDKLNQFHFWLTASNANSDSCIVKLAQQKIENILLGEDPIMLTHDEKQNFLAQPPHPALLEKWLFVEQDTSLQIRIFEQINKPQLSLKLFGQSDSTELQRYIVDNNNEISLLEKLVKKTNSTDVEQYINDKIAEITANLEKPIKLAKQIQLTLSKYLALKDIANYQDVLVKKAQIEAQWQTLQRDFELLSTEQQFTFNDKWKTIESQITKVFALKAENYQQQQIALQLAEDKITQQASFTLKAEQLSKQLSTAIYENSAIDQADFNQTIDQELQALSQSVLDSKAQQQLASQFNEARSKLLQLDVIAESITQATHLISQLSQIALPKTITEFSEKYDFYRNWQQQWGKVNAAACNLLPDSIQSSYQALTQQWQATILPFEQQLKVEFKQVKNKLHDVRQLVNRGKYNASFGVFKKAEKAYLALSSKQQQALEKDYLWCQAKINDLSDWESYIATPKKQALLAQAQTLVEQPLDNPVTQADKVKTLRKQWNTLGHAQADLNAELNTQFNLACEQAFAPCRLFFSEQEKLRALNLAAREQLIKDSRALESVTQQAMIDWKQLDRDLNKLMQQWRDAGDVDKQYYQELNQQFNQSLKPVKNAISAFHQSNVEKKKILITHAQTLSEQSENEAILQDVKRLQVKWRDIGYCGPKEENKLWQSFRAINDKIFARHKARQKNIDQQNNEQLNELSVQVNLLTEKACNKSTVTEIDVMLNQCELLTKQLSLLKPKSSLLLVQLSKQVKVLNAHKSDLITTQKNHAWQQLFSILEQKIELKENINLIQEFEQLTTKWKKRLLALPSTDADINARLEKTIALEIIAGAKSTQSDQALTMKVQVELMQQQLSNKQTITLESLLCEWLALGQLSSNDLPLINRIRPLFAQKT